MGNGMLCLHENKEPRSGGMNLHAKCQYVKCEFVKYVDENCLIENGLNGGKNVKKKKRKLYGMAIFVAAMPG
jgi:hypothetical protein